MAENDQKPIVILLQNWLVQVCETKKKKKSGFYRSAKKCVLARYKANDILEYWDSPIVVKLHRNTCLMPQQTKSFMFV